METSSIKVLCASCGKIHEVSIIDYCRDDYDGICPNCKEEIEEDLKIRKGKSRYE